MKINKVTISNWRSIDKIEIQFESLMVFIGQNNHGKSNILTALLFFFGEINCDNEDIRDGFEECFVEIVFSELDESDKTTFKKYLLHDNCVRFRRVANSANNTCSYHGYIEEPVNDWLKESNAALYAKREAINDTPLANLVSPKGRITKAEVIEAQAKYIESHNDEIEFVMTLESGNLLGLKNVAKGIWGEVFFIPAVKKASEELSTKSTTTFNRLYSRVIDAMSSSSTEFIKAKTELENLVNRLNKVGKDGAVNTKRPQELQDFESLLDGELTDWNASIDVEITPPDIDGLLRVGTNVWVDDGVRTDVSRKGQGLQRALIFALVRALSKLNDTSHEEDSPTRKASKSTYFILEEPELFLHPHAQRSLFASLKSLTDSSQVVLCTHSSAFISLEMFKSICRVERKKPTSTTTICQCVVDVFEGLDAKKKFNMVYWVNPDRGELFFSKKAILLEGPTDKTIIPMLASKLGVFKHEYSLIDCGSKDSMVPYIQLLNYFNIPYTAVYDKDHQAWKSENAIASADRSTRLIESKISHHLGSSVVFVNDIEEEIGLDPVAGSKNKPFLALEFISSDGFKISDSLSSKVKDIFS